MARDIMGVTHFSGLGIKVRLLQGGAAGNITCAGIEVGDSLESVNLLTLAHDATYGIDVSASTDITSEWTITAANTITNTGGTNTTDKYLLVVFLDGNAT